MTLDEYIKDCEQVMFGAQMMKQTEVYEYNRQLVELLRELQQWREFGNRIGQICAGFLTDEQIEKLMEVNEDERR